MTAIEEHRYVNAVRDAQSEINEAERLLYGIFGYPHDSKERQHRWDSKPAPRSEGAGEAHHLPVTVFPLGQAPF